MQTETLLRLSLPDGSSREVPPGALPRDVVASIGAGLLRAAIAVEVDGEIQDLMTPLRRGGTFRVLTERDMRALDVLRHSAAHILATAVRRRRPEAKIGFGPAIDAGRFRFDFPHFEAVARDQLVQVEDIRVRRLPTLVVGIIGGGQLARMCAGPAAELGVTLSVLAEDARSSAALVVPSSPVGEHTDVEAVRAFARECDVVTFDHEHVPAEVLQALVDDGVALHPAPGALRHAQDKLVMREALTAAGIAIRRGFAHLTGAPRAVGFAVLATLEQEPALSKGKTVRESVERLAGSVNHAQRPAIYDESRGRFVFHAAPPVPTAAAASAGSLWLTRSRPPRR